jgi:RNA polymerase sigma factor (sigma-70 family)
MTTDEQLLRQYARERSESAFAELVTRHLDCVYSAALRVVNGDTPLAQDVTQTVFIDLARQAGSLPRDAVVAGWLHRHTCYTAAKAVRTERRRQTREHTAMEMRALDDGTRPPWEQVAPYLDESLNQLNPTDRDALVLRFLRQQDLRAVGEALGISEDAARKRVDRALEKLHILLKDRGATLSLAALGTALATEAVTAAPAGLAATISSAAILAGSTTTTALTATKAIAMTTLHKTLITATIAIVAGAGIQQAYKASQLRDQVQMLQQQQTPLAEQIQELQRERDDATNRAAWALGEIDRMRRGYAQVLKLRGDLARVSAELWQLKAADSNTTNELSAEVNGWVKRGNSFKQWFKEHPEKSIPELALLWDADWIFEARVNPTVATNGTEGNTIEMIASSLRERAKSRLAAILGHALSLYVAANAGELPNSLTQLLAYLPQQGDKPITENPFASAQPVNDSMLARYELRFTGPISNVPREQPIVVEKAPADPDVDTLLKITADGFCYGSVGITDMMAGTLQPLPGEDLERIKPFLK